MITQRKEILAKAKKAPTGGDYVWDGKDDDRSLISEEMQKGVEECRKKDKKWSQRPYSPLEGEGRTGK